MDIKGINKAELLAALYNNSQPLGMGFLNPNSNSQMTVDDAQEILDTGQTYFDYLQGRVMKVDLEGDELRTQLYNRDNGDGSAERVINELLNTVN